MPTINFSIGTQSFTLTCGEGEQEHIKSLASSVNQRFETLRSTFGNAGHQLVMAVTMLMMEDDIRKLSNNPDGEIASFSAAPAIDETALRDQITAEVLQEAAERIESLAKACENV